MRCPDLDWPAQTFREQVPGLLDRYQRRTTRLAGQAAEAVRRLAPRDGAGLLAALGIPLSTEVGVASASSTLTARYLSSADGITEIRPGTYIYNDLRTLGCWSCTPEETAVTMLATVVSADGPRVTVDAGNKTLTSSTDPAYGVDRAASILDDALSTV